MSGKWTPGPWLIGEDQCVDEAWSIVTTTGGSIISNVNDRHDRLANAHLIAAAPDLYAALERALNFIANTESEMGETLPCGDDARAALAKARGEV